MTTPLLVKGPLRHWRTRDGTARGPIASKRTFSVLFGLFRHSAIFRPEPCPGPVMQTNSEKHQATRRRSEERRVGKERRSRGGRTHYKTREERRRRRGAGGRRGAVAG